MDSMRKTLYDLIKNNRNNATQKISIAMSENFSKKVGRNNNQIAYDNKYHYGNPLTLYPKSSIRKLLDDLTQSFYQNHFENLAKEEGSSCHTTEFINNIYIKFHEIDPPGVKS